MPKKNLTQNKLHSKLPKADARQALLITRRNARMARSAHAYVRGNTSKFYEWLDVIEGHALPEGPAICRSRPMNFMTSMPMARQAMNSASMAPLLTKPAAPPPLS